jgi:hypothetical protein
VKSPDKGAETDEILKEYGYRETENCELKAGGITAASLETFARPNNRHVEGISE